MQKNAPPNSSSQQPDLGHIRERNSKLRVAYLEACENLGVQPCNELVAALNINPLNSKNKKKFLLRRLSLCHAEIGDDHFQAIVNALEQHGQSITELIFNHNNITDRGVCNFLIPYLDSPGTVIHTLELFGNKVGNESCKHFLNMLRGNETLLRLKLGDNCVTTAGTQYLADGLRHNNTLIQLHIGGNNIGDTGVTALANALRGNTTLTSLGLRDNNISLAGVHALTQLLSLPHCRLAEVQLKGNRIGLHGACEVLAQAISRNSSLLVLELQSNKIDADGAYSLCQSLCVNKCIHALNFNDNALNDDGAAHISTLLEQNQRITTVGLSGNGIAKRGASALWKALQHSNNTLIGIDLGNNNLGNVCVPSGRTASHCISLYVCVLPTLTAAAQGGRAQTDNEIHQEGGEALYQYLKNNTTLRNFNYGGQGTSANKIHPFTRRQINSIITRNRRAWHAANTAAQEPAEDEEEDEILPELGGRDSTATGLGLNAPDCAPPNGDSQRADVSPARPGLAVSQQPQPQTPQRLAKDYSPIPTSNPHEGVYTPLSPAPHSPPQPHYNHFQSLAHHFQFTASPSPGGGTNPATPSPHGPPVPSPSPDPSLTYSQHMQPHMHPHHQPQHHPPHLQPPYQPPHPHLQQQQHSHSHTHVSGPRLPTPSPPMQPPQALDTPMAGTELDLLPEPEAGVPSPLAGPASAPAARRYTAYHLMHHHLHGHGYSPSSTPSPTPSADLDLDPHAAYSSPAGRTALHFPRYADDGGRAAGGPSFLPTLAPPQPLQPQPLQLAMHPSASLTMTSQAPMPTDVPTRGTDPPVPVPSRVAAPATLQQLPQGLTQHGGAVLHPQPLYNAPPPPPPPLHPPPATQHPHPGGPRTSQPAGARGPVAGMPQMRVQRQLQLAPPAACFLLQPGVPPQVPLQPPQPQSLMQSAPALRADPWPPPPPPPPAPHQAPPTPVPRAAAPVSTIGPRCSPGVVGSAVGAAPGAGFAPPPPPVSISASFPLPASQASTQPLTNPLLHGAASSSPSSFAPTSSSFLPASTSASAFAPSSSSPAAPTPPQGLASTVGGGATDSGAWERAAQGMLRVPGSVSIAKATAGGPRQPSGTGAQHGEIPTAGQRISEDAGASSSRPPSPQRASPGEALTDLLTQLLAGPAPAHGADDSDEEPSPGTGGPTPLLSGANPFQTINQQLAAPLEGSAEACGWQGSGGVTGSGCSEVSEPGISGTISDNISLHQLSESFKQLTRASGSAKPAMDCRMCTDKHPLASTKGGVGSISAAADSAANSMGPRGGSFAAPADMRGGAAAAANLATSAAAAFGPCESVPLSASVFAPRAIDLPALCPNEF